MNPELKARIESQAAWTFPECLALGAEFGIKTRFVVAMVMMLGRTYVDGEAGSYGEGRGDGYGDGSAARADPSPKGD